MMEQIGVLSVKHKLEDNSQYKNITILHNKCFDYNFNLLDKLV